MRFFLAVLPVPFFYMIYFRYFAFKPEILKHIEAFLYGILIAILLLLISPYILMILPFQSNYVSAFLNAAFFEKILTVIAVILVFRHYPNFSIIEAILASIMVALGFSVVENVFYAYKFGDSIIIVRMLFTVPLHISTTGLIGYYLGIMSMSGSKISKKIYLLKALILPMLFHGIFDYLLLSDNIYSLMSVPLLLVYVSILEIKLSYSETIPGKAVLDALGIDFPIHAAIEKQQKYERWIQRSFRSDDLLPNFFYWKPGVIRVVAVFAFMIIALAGMSYGENIENVLKLNLSDIESFMVFGVFPISISIILIIVGAVNPEFFQESEIKIPVINDVVINNDSEFEELFVTYSITYHSIFLKTYEPIGVGKEVSFGIDLKGFSNTSFKGIVKWENHSIANLPYGTIVHFENRNIIFYYYLIKYQLYRSLKGLILNLKLPGFETSKKLYAQPVSAMTEDKVYENGEIVFREGETSKNFYLLKKGKVLIYKKMNDYEIITKDLLEEGEMFGEMGLLSDKTRSSSAICVGECVIAEADLNNLNYLLRHNPDFAQKMLLTVIERFKRSEDILIEKIFIIEDKTKI